MNKPNIKPGTYQHYKGNKYQVIETATHSETLEHLVVYRPLYGEEALWVRPFEMFNDEIEIDGKKLKRFQFIK